MFKREVKPLSESMAEVIAKSINKLQYVEEKASRPADREEGDVKAQDITGEEPVKTDGSASKAPARKADKSGAEPMQKVKEEVELDEARWEYKGDKTYMVGGNLRYDDKIEYKLSKADADVLNKYMKQAKSDAERSKVWTMFWDSKETGDKATGPAKAIAFAKKAIKEEVEVLDESKALLKDYQAMKAQGKKDSSIMDVLMSMPKYKKMSRDQMAKVIGDAKRKGIFKEDVEITELHMSLLEAHGIEKKVAERVKKVFDAMSTEDKAAFMKSYLKNPKAATEYMFKGMQKMAKEEVEIEEAMDPVDAKALKGKHSERKDKDIDNDGDVDSSDEYLHKRRKAISKAMKKEEVELEENADIWSKNPTLKKNHKEVTALWDKYESLFNKQKSAIGTAEYRKLSDEMAKVKSSIDKINASTLQTLKSLGEEVELDEAYTINHKTFSSAVQHAKAQVEKQGYTIDDDEWDRKVAMGPKKPGTGKTNRYTIDLMKGGKETRRKLQMQVYYDEGRYELNMYIS